jgi:hypothetical protein
MKGAFGEMDKINNKVTDKNKEAMIAQGIVLNGLLIFFLYVKQFHPWLIN